MQSTVLASQTESIYKTVYFRERGHKTAWQEARRFYAAARRRDWWVALDGTRVNVTDVSMAEIRALVDHLGCDAKVME